MKDSYLLLSNAIHFFPSASNMEYLRQKEIWRRYIDSLDAGFIVSLLDTKFLL